MKLIQIHGRNLIDHVIDNYFEYKRTPDVETMLHLIKVRGKAVGFVATEKFDKITGTHLFIRPDSRNAEVLTEVSWIYNNVYCPLMRALGFEMITTSCHIDDKATQNFLSKAGFNLEEVCVGTYLL